MPQAIHTVSSWSDGEIDSLLSRAGELADGASPIQHRDLLIGMCIFQTSLRTRVGFEAATYRIGARFVEAVERRSSADSMPESTEDTIRVMSGYCDALVVRADRSSTELSRAARANTGWVNAGDATEHPTQALIDLFAITRLVGPVAQARIAIVGDLRMRAAHSLLALLRRRPPAALALVSAPQMLGTGLPSASAALSRVADLVDFAPDVIYLVGIPHQAVTEQVRTMLRLGRGTLGALSPDAVVLSPLPLIDEIASNARGDARIRWFDQSDLGLHVRTAVLESLVD